MRYISKISNKQLWFGSVTLFAAGILLPMFSFSKFLIFNDTYSLLGGVLHLLAEGEIFLFLVVFSFSIVLPSYKLYISRIIIDSQKIDGERRVRLIQRLSSISKWSMADVFVISIIAATVKLGIFASITVHFGLYVFGAAVLASMILVQRLMSGYSLRPISVDT